MGAVESGAERNDITLFLIKARGTSVGTERVKTTVGFYWQSIYLIEC